jgi:hypothetical protein
MAQQRAVEAQIVRITSGKEYVSFYPASCYLVSLAKNGY